MSLRNIPVMKPKLPELKYVKKYLKEMEKNRVYSNNGSLVQRLENRFANYFKVDKDLVVLCSNATTALQGAAFLVPVREFSVPAFTFTASLTGVLNSGKKIDLHDIGLHDWKITGVQEGKEKALVEVLPFGAPLKMDENPEWDYKIIDAAASIGADPCQLDKMKTNWVTVFSLHATKLMGVGEGGIAIFKSKNFAQEFRSWINFGFAGNRNSNLPGINGKMSEITAAYGHAVLDWWDDEKNLREKIRDKINKISADLSIESITHSYPGVNPYWIADFKDSGTANRIENFLISNKIETRRWWSFGCHKMPAFSNLSAGKSFPNTDAVASKTLGLPNFVDLSNSQLDRIRDCLETALSIP
jgi:dTDP-4-amino-4,6-dideoxygalactose transaminase